MPGAIEVAHPGDRPCEHRYIAAADALFAFGSAQLDAGGERALAGVLAEVRRRVPTLVRVRGHTDAIGTDGANRALSTARAEAVADWLLRRLGQHVEFKVEAAGEAEPVAPNQTPEGADDPLGRARNRRVEIILDSPDC